MCVFYAPVDVNSHIQCQKQSKQVNLTLLFEHIPSAIPEHMICSTLFLQAHREKERNGGIDVDLLEWVLVHEMVRGYLAEP